MVHGGVPLYIYIYICLASYVHLYLAYIVSLKMTSINQRVSLGFIDGQLSIGFGKNIAYACGVFDCQEGSQRGRNGGGSKKVVPKWHVGKWKPKTKTRGWPQLFNFSIPKSMCFARFGEICVFFTGSGPGFDRRTAGAPSAVPGPQACV